MYGLAIGSKNEEASLCGCVVYGQRDRGVQRFRNRDGRHHGHTSLACGIKLLADGSGGEPGVFSPEAGHIEPRQFCPMFSSS